MSRRSGKEDKRPTRRARRRRRPRPLRRAALVLFVLLVLLGVGLVVAVETVRRGDLPRSIAERAASQALGLRVELGAVELAWSGRTEIRDLRVRAPLDDDPLIEVDRIHAAHAHLLRIAVTRDPGLRRLELEGTRVLAERDLAGQWNVIEAIERVGQAVGPGAGGGVPGLPELVAEAITVRLRDRGRELEPVTIDLRGEPEHALAYRFTLEVGPIATVRGRVGVGADWAHRVAFELRTLEPVAPFLPDERVQDATASGRWSGTVADGGLSGRLELDALDAPDVHVRGGALVSVRAGVVTAEPRDLVVRVTGAEELILTGGTVRFQGDDIAVQRLRARAYNATADIDGAYSLSREAGSVYAVWSGRAIGPVSAHHGRASISVALSEAGRTIIEGMTEATADVRGGARVRVDTNFDANGLLPDQLAAGMRFRTLRYTPVGEDPIDFSGLEAGATLADGTARLTRLVIPGARASRADARLALDTGAWRVDLAAEDWVLPRIEEAGPVSLSIRGAGVGIAAESWDLSVDSGFADVRASGSYDPLRPAPLVAGATVAVRIADVPQDNGVPALLTGSALATLNLAGTLEPLSLGGEGRLALTGLHVRGTRLEDMLVSGRGLVHEGMAAFDSEEFEIFGGVASLWGSLGTDGTLAVRIAARDIDLDDVSALAGLEDGPGGRAMATLELDIPRGDGARGTLTGRWSASDIAYEPFLADRARGRISVNTRRAAVDEIRVERGAGVIGGRLEYDLASDAGIDIDFRADAWPLDVGPLSLLLEGRAAGRVDVDALAADLTIDGFADVGYAGVSVGRWTVDALVDGRKLVAHDILAFAAGGRIAGSASIPLESWTDTTAELTFNDVDIPELVAMFAPDELPEGLAGRLSGTLTLRPAPDAQTFGPLVIEAAGRFEDGVFRTIALDGFDVRAGVGDERMVLERADLALAGGTVGVWGTSAMHGSERFVRLNAELGRLDLDQIMRAADPELELVPGRLSGRVVAGGYAAAPNRLFGESTLLIEESDLANVGPIAFLYSALNIRFGDRAPTGRGVAEIRLEGEALDVTRFQYFNRGVDVVATLRAERILDGAESPLSGYAGGSLRPLRDVGLPFAATLDRLLAGAQADAVTVRIGGTLGDIDVRVVPFAEAFGGLSRLLGGRERPE